MESVEQLAAWLKSARTAVAFTAGWHCYARVAMLKAAYQTQDNLRKRS